MRKYKLLGHVSVDSGQIFIGDPCHKDRPDLGVKIDGFGGDGFFPVAGTFDEEGRLIGATIIFDVSLGLDAE